MNCDFIKVGKSKFGKGVFARSNILKGQTILTLEGGLVIFSDTTKMGIQESYPIQIDIDKYINPLKPFCYINHSCEPNCGIKEGCHLVAIQDIFINDEIFYDYSTTMLEKSWEMKCLCETKSCRKVIQDFDLLPTYLQRKYLGLNIVQPFIKKQIHVRYI